MQVNVKLGKDEVARAVYEYMMKKGYKIERYGFDTGCSYSRVLFDSKLDSWFNGMNLVVSEVKK